MSCTHCGPRPGPECGYAYPYSGFFYDRYPPLRCPDDFYRQEMCDYLADGFGCGMMPPPFYPPDRPPPPPAETSGDISTRPQFQRRPLPTYMSQPIPPGNERQPSSGRTSDSADSRGDTTSTPRMFAAPAGTVGSCANPMDTRITQNNLRDYYNAWTRIRSIKPYMPVPYTVPNMSCQARYMGDGSTPSGCSQARRYAPMIRTQCEVPPGLVGDGPVTTRPPPLDDAAVNAADEALEDAQDALDEAVAAGSESAVSSAQSAVDAARENLERVLYAKGVSVSDYKYAKSQEASAAQATAEEAKTTETKKSLHPAWYVGMAAGVIMAGYAGYKAGGG